MISKSDLEQIDALDLPDVPSQISDYNACLEEDLPRLIQGQFRLDFEITVSPVTNERIALIVTEDTRAMVATDYHPESIEQRLAVWNSKYGQRREPSIARAKAA